ncbi:MAG: type II secretion system protein N [Pseudomonadota bacterium]
MKRALGLTAVGLVLLVFGASTLPARLLPALLPAELVRLSGVSGSLLNGQAARAQVSTGAGMMHLGRVNWEFHPRSLLALAPRITLNSNWGAQRGSASLAWRPGRVVVSDLDASVDARLLRTLAPLAVEGRVGLQFERIVLRDGLPAEARGRVVLQDARWNAPQVDHTLGSYVADIDGDARQELRARVDTIAGPVPARGTVTLAATRYELDVRIGDAATRLATEIERALELFATPTEDGYRLRLGGNLIVGSPPP